MAIPNCKERTRVDGESKKRRAKREGKKVAPKVTGSPGTPAGGSYNILSETRTRLVYYHFSPWSTRPIPVPYLFIPSSSTQFFARPSLFLPSLSPALRISSPISLSLYLHLRFLLDSAVREPSPSLQRLATWLVLFHSLTFLFFLSYFLPRRLLPTPRLVPLRLHPSPPSKNTLTILCRVFVAASRAPLIRHPRVESF